MMPAYPSQAATPKRPQQEHGSHHDSQSQVMTQRDTKKEETPNTKTKTDQKKQKEPAEAVYCKQCQTWLNGPRQWEDHKIGKKHRKNVQKEKAAATSSSSATAAGTMPKDAAEPEQKSAMWDWLEQGRKEKLKDKKARQGVLNARLWHSAAGSPEEELSGELQDKKARV